MRRERLDKMNVVPFIDIVLVLLVIVLATATFVQQKSINVHLPKASTAAVKSPEPIVISIDKKGGYYYNKKPISWDALNAKLTALNAQKDRITLYTDKGTPFEYFLRVIDTLKAKGFEKVSVAAQP